MVLQALDAGFVTDNAVLQHDVRFDDLAAFVTRRADHRALGDIGMCEKGGFNFRSGDVVA